MSKVWYFAYGSNLDIGQMMTRVGEWEISKKAMLHGWELVFDKPSKWWQAAANIRKNSSEIVFGVVYLITAEKFEVLKTYELGYDEIVIPRDTIDFESNESEVSVKTFVYTRKNSPKKPHPKYLNLIVKGLKQHGYEEDVIERVKQIACC